MIQVHSRVRLRHGRATLEGEVIALLDDGRKATVRVEREGEEPIELTRNVTFLDPLDAPSSGRPHPKQ